MRVTRKIWIGIGAATIAHAGSDRVAAQPPLSAASQAAPDALLHRVGKDHPPGQAGATGGETYLRDGGASDTRTRFSRDLMLVQGHALIADELAAVGQWPAARAHLTTSTEELRAYLEPYMRGQGLAPFTAIVEKLSAAAARSDRPSYAAARRDLDGHMAAADTAIRKFQLPQHRFQLRAAIEVLKAASSAYDASVGDGRIADPVEYRDGRGYLLAAEKAIVAIEADLAKTDAAQVRQIKLTLGELKRAWPATVAPSAIVMSVEGVALLVAKIEALSAIDW